MTGTVGGTVGLEQAVVLCSSVQFTLVYDVVAEVIVDGCRSVLCRFTSLW